MSCGFLADGVRNVLGDGSQLGIRLRFVEEPDPRGTAGALKFAEPMLDERFLMLNGDVLTDIDLTAQIAQHEATGARATLALVPVPDPSAYGLVLLAEDRSVSDFVEKPSSDDVDDEPDQRRRVRARARDPRAGRRPSATSRSSARSGRCWSATVSTGSPRRATGWTSARPSATCRAPSTSSRATSRRRCASGSASDWLAIDEGARGARPGDPAGGARARRARRARARTSAAWWCSPRTCRSARAHRRARGDPAGARRSARAASCATASSPPAAASARGTKITGGAVLGEGVTVGADNVITRGARIFPGVELPDGAIEF